MNGVRTEKILFANFGRRFAPMVPEITRREVRKEGGKMVNRWGGSE